MTDNKVGLELARPVSNYRGQYESPEIVIRGWGFEAFHEDYVDVSDHGHGIYGL